MRFTKHLTALRRLALRPAGYALLALIGFGLSTGEAAAADPPYWAAMRADEVNARVGPSQEYKIRWVYKREGLPIKVIRVMEGWRLIRDSDGDEGWVVASLLTDRRGGLIIGSGLAAMRAGPNEGARLKWNLEPGVVGRLGECDVGWCLFDVTGRRGYVREDRIWGAGAP